MNGDVEACLVGEEATLRDAMIALDRGARRIALAVDPGGVLVGIVTDGDIRRALLGGAALDDPLAPSCRASSFVSTSERKGWRRWS